MNVVRNVVLGVVRGAVGGGATADPLPLDSVAAAGAVYSVARRLLTSYTGPLIRVRRDSDDAELDIGYTDDNVLDESALTTFTGANNGLLRTIYDQSGNEFDLEQSDSAQQHRFVVAGAIVKLNTKPAVECLTTRHMLTGAVFTYTAMSYCGVARLAIDAGGLWQFGTYDTGAGLRRATTLIARNQAAAGSATIAHSLIAQNQISVTQTANSRNIWLDGTAGTQNTTSGVLNESSKILHFACLTPTVYRMQGYQHEAIFWLSAISDADRQAVEANQKAFYGTP